MVLAKCKECGRAILRPGRDVTHAIDLAATQLGIKEETGHNDGIPADRYMRGDELAWCAGFVLWCYDESDDPDIPEAPSDYWKLRNVDTMEKDLKRRGLWIGPSVIPAPNDLIFYRNRGSSDSGSGRHVGIVERVSGGIAYTIEGNLGDEVRRSSEELDSDRITGYGRPARYAIKRKR